LTLDELDRWADVARHAAWQLAADDPAVTAVRLRTAELVVHLGLLRRDALPQLADDPWQDLGYARRLTDQIAALLVPSKGHVRLSAAECAALLAAPYVYDTLWSGLVAAARRVDPQDLTPSPDASSDRAAFERFAQTYAQPYRRAVTAIARGDGDAAIQIGWWLLHHYVGRQPAAYEPAAVIPLLDPIASGAGTGREPDRTLFASGWLSQLVWALRADPGFFGRPDRVLALEQAAPPGVRARLVAHLLMAARALCVETVALSEVIVEHLGIGDPTSSAALGRTVARLTWQPRGTALVLTAACGHPAEEVALRTHADVANQVLTEIHRAAAADPALADLRVLPSHVTADGLRPAEVDGRLAYQSAGVRFRLAEDRVRELLMGEQLYGDPALAIRELYQNALDACRYRQARTEYLRRAHGHQIDWTGQIRFEQGTDEHGRAYLDCLDNGVGMGVRELSDVFAQAGVRLGDLAEFLEEQAEWARLDPPVLLFTNSRFGIGVLSYFMIAEELTIRTCQMRRDGRPGPLLEVSIAGPGSLFRIREVGPGTEPGTTVRLHLRATSVSCVDTLREVLWVADFDTRANDGKRSHAWPAGELSSATGPAHPERGGVVADLAAGVWWCHGDGALLADGLWAGKELPGVVVNLRRERAPRLSVDRTKILGYREEDVEALLWQAVPTLIAAGVVTAGEDQHDAASLRTNDPGAQRAVLSYPWLHEFTKHRPLIADAIFEQALAAGRTRWKMRGKSIEASIAGCFAPDTDSPKGPDPQVEWRLTALAAAGLYTKRLLPAPDWRRVLRARPSDAILLSVDLDARPPWLDPVRPVALGHLLLAAKRLGRGPSELAARLDELGYNTVPAHGTFQPEPHDIALISRDLDAAPPWLDPVRPVTLPRLLASAATVGLPVQAVATRMRELGFHVESDVPETDARDLALVSRNADGRAPWLQQDQVVGLGHLLTAASRTGTAPRDVVVRLRELGFTVWADLDRLPTTAEIDPAEVVIVSRDLDGVDPWLDPARPVTTPHLFRCWANTGLPVPDVAARLRRLGFSVRLDPDRVPGGEPDPADLVITSRDLDGSHPWLDENEPVSPVHLMLAARRVGRSAGAVAARLASMGYLLAVDPSQLGTIDDDDLVIISRDLDGKHPWLEVGRAVPMLHLLRATDVTGSTVEDVSTRLARLGYRLDRALHEIPVEQFGPDDATITSVDLDGEQPWLDVDKPVPMLHLLRAAKAVDRDVADVAARLILFGYTVDTDLGLFQLDKKAREDLVIIASEDFDGEDSFLDLDERVPLGHMLNAARRTHRSPQEIADWLRWIGYTVDEPAAIPPDGVRSADITLLSADLDGESPWLNPHRRVSFGHLFAAARKIRRSIDEVSERLALYGFRVAEPGTRLPRLRPGGAWHLLLEVATDDPEGLPGYVHGLEADGAGIAHRLRDAVITALLSTKRPDPRAVEALRRLADSYDQMPDSVAESDAVHALLFDGARHRELGWFEAGVERLANLDHFDPPLRDDGLGHGTPSDVAAMVADLGKDRRGLLLKLAPHLDKLGFTGEPLERILAQLIAASLVDNQREHVAYIIPLVPDPVTFDVLAFNLACMHARYADRHGVLRYSRVALQLGRSPIQFLSDDDFAGLRDDPEFVALLDEFR
jgi:hypothetical protein